MCLISCLMMITAFLPGCEQETAVPSFDSRTIRLIQASLDSSLDEIGVPGAAVAVVSPEGAVWKGASGISDIQNNTAMTPDLKFRIGSLTKTFTAVVILQLVQEAKLSLDQTLDSLFPGIVPDTGKITVRQLLNHTSGLFDYAQAENPSFLEGIRTSPLKQYSPEDLIAVSNNNPPCNAAGEGFHYSNTNYILLGMIIEKITGNAYGEEVYSRIINPLHLDSTSVPETPDMPDGSTHGYTFIDGALLDTSRIDTSWAFSAGNMISNAQDLLTFLDAVIRGTLLDEKHTAEMFTFVEVFPTMQYGLGLEKTGEAIGHTGDFVFGGQAAMYGLKGWRFIILTNASPSKDIDSFGSEHIMFTIIKNLDLTLTPDDDPARNSREKE